MKTIDILICAAFVSLFACKRLPISPAMSLPLQDPKVSIVYTSPPCGLSDGECYSSNYDLRHNFFTIYSIESYGSSVYRIDANDGSSMHLSIIISIPDTAKNANLNIIKNYPQDFTKYSMYIKYSSGFRTFSCISGTAHMYKNGPRNYSISYCSASFYVSDTHVYETVDQKISFTLP